jgi:hypothetical protein
MGLGKTALGAHAQIFRVCPGRHARISGSHPASLATACSRPPAAASALAAAGSHAAAPTQATAGSHAAAATHATASSTKHDLFSLCYAAHSQSAASRRPTAGHGKSRFRQAVTEEGIQNLFHIAGDEGHQFYSRRGNQLREKSGNGTANQDVYLQVLQAFQPLARRFGTQGFMGLSNSLIAVRFNYQQTACCVEDR